MLRYDHFVLFLFFFVDGRGHNKIEFRDGVGKNHFGWVNFHQTPFSSIVKIEGCLGRTVKGFL